MSKAPDPNPLHACAGIIHEFGLDMTELAIVVATLGAALQRRKNNRNEYIKNIANVQKVSNALLSLELAEKFKREQFTDIVYVNEN